MKKYIMYLLFFLFLILTCSQEVMLTTNGYNNYKGEMENIFNDDDAKLGVTFNYPPSMYLELNIDTYDDDRVIKFEDGSYHVDNNYNFTANLDEDVDFNVVLWKNIIDSSGIEKIADIDLDEYKKIVLELELEGYLNGNIGKGEGDYKMECTVTINTGEKKKGEIKGDWKLVRR